jgi:Ca2+-binding RTX toxin-like protein
MSRLIRRALIAAVLPAAIAAVALPSAAQAVTIGLANGNLGVTDTGTEHNNLVLRVVGSEIVITDSVPFSPLGAGHSCRLVNQTQVFCPAGSASQVGVFTGLGNDTVGYRLPHQGHVDLGAGSDRLVAGTRQALGRAIQPVRYLADSFFGPNGHDEITFAGADAGVNLTPEDNLANDGRLADRENVGPGFETIVGSQHDDRLFGTDLPEFFFGLGGNDFLAGGHGDDMFLSYNAQDGADDHHGGPGFDSIDYFGRNQPVRVSLDNVPSDGESGEGDNVRTNVENTYGGNAGDFFESHGAHSRLDGRGGDDVLLGGAGPDTLIGGPGLDLLNSGQGNDVVDSRDGQLDTIDCSQDTDSLVRDNTERSVVACENVAVGTLTLTPKSTTVAAGKATRLKLGWRHPKAWKQLRAIVLRVTSDDVPVGTVTIRARGKKITGTGAVRVQRATKITTTGKTVTARLALRFDDRVAGRSLKAEVEATDRRGRRQLERRAATIRIAGN